MNEVELTAEELRMQECALKLKAILEEYGYELSISGFSLTPVK